MAFCFPGYDAKGSDLPPPPVCARTWRSDVLARLVNVKLTLLIGSYAQSWHLGLPKAARMTKTVASWADHLPHAVPLPHPSWRNTGWIRKNPWFESDLLPCSQVAHPRGIAVTDTPLDAAHAAMIAARESDESRLRFFQRLADSELFLALNEESTQPDSPRLFETSNGPLVLAFDTEARLAEFAGGPAQYAALSGRSIAEMLTGQGVGLALNPDVAPSSMFIPAEALDWLHEMLANTPMTHDVRPIEVRRPSAPLELIEGLDAKLAAAAGLASHAWLADVTYPGGAENMFLAIVDAAPGSEVALSRAVSEALVFSGLGTGVLDVAFFDADDPITRRLAQVGLRVDLPAPDVPKAPGTDKDNPPRLR